MNFKNTSAVLLMILGTSISSVSSADVDIIESEKNQPSKTIQIASEGFSTMCEGVSEVRVVYKKAMPEFKKISTGFGVLGITTATVFATYDVTLIYHNWVPITEATTQIMTSGQELVALAPVAYESASKIASGSMKIVTAGIELGKKVVATTVNVANQGIELGKKVVATTVNVANQGIELGKKVVATTVNVANQGIEFAQKGAKLVTSFASNLWSWGYKAQIA